MAKIMSSDFFTPYLPKPVPINPTAQLLFQLAQLSSQLSQRANLQLYVPANPLQSNMSNLTVPASNASLLALQSLTQAMFNMSGGSTLNAHNFDHSSNGSIKFPNAATTGTVNNGATCGTATSSSSGIASNIYQGHQISPSFGKNPIFSKENLVGNTTLPTTEIGSRHCSTAHFYPTPSTSTAMANEILQSRQIGQNCAKSPDFAPKHLDFASADLKTAPHSIYLPQCSTPRIDQLSKKPKSQGSRLSYPREFKLMVINHYNENGRNKYRTCKQFQITKSMLNGWLQRAENIRQSRPGSMKSGRSGRKPHFPEVEEKLFEIYGKEEDFKNNQWLRETAKKLANEVKFDNSKGQFSERWLANFKRRYQLENEKGWRESRNSLTETESHSDTESESMCGAEIGSDWASGLKELAGELLGQPQPPIHGFYRRFPELRRKTPAAKRKRTI